MSHGCGSIVVGQAVDVHSEVRLPLVHKKAPEVVVADFASYPHRPVAKQNVMWVWHNQCSLDAFIAAVQ